jgi:CRISPR-associated protein Csm4
MADFLIKFNFLSPMRIGQEEIDLQGLADGLHSDTLFSALCHALAELYGSDWLEQWLQTYQTKPPLLMSSAFPFYQDQFYLPRPFLAAPEHSEGEQNAKLLTNLRWLSPHSLWQWLRGQGLDPQQLQMDKENTEKLEQVFTMPRVSLDRVSNASNIFYCTQQSFIPQSGLYCILRMADEHEITLLQSAFAYLGECGLGSERNNGYGRFAPEWMEPNAEFKRLLTNKGERYYLLGLYHPGTAAIELQNTGYGLIHRRGWFYSISSGKQYKRRSVWMFQEGSVLRQEPAGCLVDVTPSVCGPDHHRIFKNGMTPCLQF